KETVRDAARRLARKEIKGPFKPEGLHEYCDAEGRPVYWRWRVRQASGAKTIRPMYWNGSSFVVGEPEAPAEGKHLYCLPELMAADPAAIVLIVEGEWCADHLRKLGLIVTTSGSMSSARGANWTPLLSRHCLLWPDHDAAGEKYGVDVAAILRELK